MNENKIKRLLKLRYFFALILISFYLLYKQWIYVETYYVDPVILPVSAILILINNRWIFRALILLNVFSFVSLLIYVIKRCQERFPTNTLRDSYYWLIELSSFHWTVAFWLLQICLVGYLITLEVKAYKNKNSLA